MKSKSKDMNKELQQDRLKRAINDLCNATDLLKKIRDPKTRLQIIRNGVSKTG